MVSSAAIDADAEFDQPGTCTLCSKTPFLQAAVGAIELQGRRREAHIQPRPEEAALAWIHPQNGKQSSS